MKALELILLLVATLGMAVNVFGMYWLSRPGGIGVASRIMSVGQRILYAGAAASVAVAVLFIVVHH